MATIRQQLIDLSGLTSGSFREHLTSINKAISYTDKVTGTITDIGKVICFVSGQEVIFGKVK
jgi:hypothetical protein